MICSSRNQLPIHSTLLMFAHLIRSLSYEHVLRAPEKAFSSSDDSGGMESIVMAMRLSRGYLLRYSDAYHHCSGGINGNVLGHGVVFIHNEPAHIDFM